MPSYVELHASSAFSFLRGSSQPEDLVKTAAALELPGLAVLDRDVVAGAPRVYSAANDANLRAYVGAEVTLDDGSALPLLVANRTGYQNLCRLLTRAKLDARSPLIAPADLPPGVDPHERKRPCFATAEELAEQAEGLIALTGDEEGPVARALARGDVNKAAEILAALKKTFGAKNVYVEVQRRRLRGEDHRFKLLADLAAAHKLPLLATGGVVYDTKGSRKVADAFTCLRHHTLLDQAGRLLSQNSERHLRSPQEMADLFHDCPAAVANSVRLSERLEFSLRNLGYRFPDYPLPLGSDPDDYLRARTYEGARERFGRLTPQIETQLNKELALIKKLGFAGYFLIVWDICRWCRQQGVLIQGRGSAANSAVCYSLRITAVDPIKQRLLFERFLSEGRVGADGHPSWPDIDLDLPSGDLRESVIQEIYRRYAPRGAAMVANVITYRGRSAIREMGKVLGLSDDVMDRFSSLYANGDFPHTIELEDQLRLAGLAKTHPRLPALVSLYQGVYGLPRHLGQHSGGMVLCPQKLDTIVPIENASMPGRTIVQWDKDDCEELGLVKIDFLGLGMMAVLQDSLTLCQKRGGPSELYKIPTDDRATFEAMCKADTIGVFQIESRAQMSTLPRFKPREFYDVAIQVAIIRPGPIVGKLVHPIIKRRNERETVVYIDPSLEPVLKPILERTYGVILFQEQMLQIAMVLADFTGAEAEELRRAMGFNRNNNRLIKVTEKLRANLAKKNYATQVVEKIVEAVSSFAFYGFPESHAISFALLANASTWLKVHRPAEFTASLLNNQPMGFYSPATILQDGRRHGLKVRPPCILKSEWQCIVETDGALRLGLQHLKGMRENNVRAMLATRTEKPFASLNDFLARTTFTAAERRCLAAVGTLNALAGHRRAALWQIEAAWSAEETLFRHFSDELLQVAESPLLPMTLSERLNADFAEMSLTAGSHPMATIRAQLPDVLRASDLPLGRDGERVTIAGSVICRQRPGTAKGFVFVSLEDETGIANAVVRPDLFERLRLVLTQESSLRITGPLQNQEGVIHVKAEKIVPLRFAEVPEQASHDFH